MYACIRRGFHSKLNHQCSANFCFLHHHHHHWRPLSIILIGTRGYTYAWKYPRNAQPTRSIVVGGEGQHPKVDYACMALYSLDHFFLLAAFNIPNHLLWRVVLVVAVVRPAEKLVSCVTSVMMPSVRQYCWPPVHKMKELLEYTSISTNILAHIYWYGSSKRAMKYTPFLKANLYRFAYCGERLRCVFNVLLSSWLFF